jgi:hypothetical protein
MEQTECSETSAHKIQTPGNYPEENIQGAEVLAVLVNDITDVVAVVVEDNTQAVAVVVEDITEVVAVLVKDITEVVTVVL